MAISQAVCNTFKRDLLKGFHDFASGGSTFKIALFTSSASLDATTENYSTTNEIPNTSGSAYTAGGETLTGQSVTGGTVLQQHMLIFQKILSGLLLALQRMER